MAPDLKEMENFCLKYDMTFELGFDKSLNISSAAGLECKRLKEVEKNFKFKTI